ncbi:hypothetical protein NE689_12050 [Lactonifactor longoviformis]|uniref:hypothetical protein n=1 Tax=Lactonifactor longoviformis TaxID=341220 RepID=UPI00210A3A0F|nr:hypothetical protein [Lactonifactor longoviformis]MCQ4672053.1 hypothetical protein [Lactonifactor longoviformis]
MRMKKGIASVLAVVCSLSITATVFAGTGETVPVQSEITEKTEQKDQEKEKQNTEGNTVKKEESTAKPGQKENKEKDKGKTPDKSKTEDKSSEETGKKEEGVPGDSKNDETNTEDIKKNEKTDEEKKKESVKETENEKKLPDSTQPEEKANVPAAKGIAAMPKAVPANVYVPQAKAGNSNTEILTSMTSGLSWAGSGTKDDPKSPIYPNEYYKRTSRNVLVVQAVDSGAKVNDQDQQISLPLSYGTNICEFYVRASDGTTVAYYSMEVYRNKAGQNDWPRDLGVEAPSAPGASDGKILYLKSDVLYDYRIANGEWKSVPAGSTEIPNLASGSYEVRFAETDTQQAGYNVARVYIYEREEYNISVDDGLPDEIKNSIEIPDKAAYGSSVTLKIPFTSRKLVTEVGYKITAGGTFGGTLTGFDYFEGNTYVLVFTMPKNNVHIDEIIVDEAGNWHTITKQDGGVYRFIQMDATVQTPGDMMTKKDVKYFRHGTQAEISLTSYSDPQSYEVTSFEVKDSKGNVVARSADGSKISVTAEDDLTVVPGITVHYADLTELNKLLAQAPTQEELSLYTDDTAKEMADCLALVPNMSDVLVSSQWLVDDFAARVQKALNALVYRDVDYTKLQESLDRIPKDTGDFTEETVNKMNKLAEEARDAIGSKWDIRRQGDVDNLTEALNAAIDGLTMRPADYSKVEAAKKKVPKDLSVYTDDSVKKLRKALDAVVEGLDFTHQEEVDKMAADIETAVKALVKKKAEDPNKKKPVTEPKKDTKSDDKKNTKSPKTKDEAPVLPLTILCAGTGLAALIIRRRRKSKKA